MADRVAVDTSVLVAAHVEEHEFHDVAADAAAAATDALGQVMVETWSVLRRAFRLDADAVSEMLLDYVKQRKLVPPTVEAYRAVLRTGRALALAGNVHDAVIVRTAEEAGIGVDTLDTGLHRLADGVIACRLLSR